MSDSATPWTTPTRCLCPWDSPGKSTGVGCHSFLQEIFWTQGLNPGLPPCSRGFTICATRMLLGSPFQHLSEDAEERFPFLRVHVIPGSVVDGGGVWRRNSSKWLSPTDSGHPGSGWAGGVQSSEYLGGGLGAHQGVGWALNVAGRQWVYRADNPEKGATHAVWRLPVPWAQQPG